MKTLLEVFMKIRVCLVKHLVKYVYSTIPDILNIFRHPCRLSVDFSFSRPAWIFTGQKTDMFTLELFFWFRLQNNKNSW